GVLYGAILFPLLGLPTGLLLLTFYAAAAVALTWRCMRALTSSSFILALLSIAALFGQLESSLIMPEFYLQYYPVMMFALVVLSLAVYEWLIARAVEAGTGPASTPVLLPAALAVLSAVWWYGANRALARISHDG